MLTIEDAAVTLGLTPRQVYRRVSTVRPLLAPYVRRGQNGKLLLDSSAIEILRRAENLRKEGLTVEEAVAQIREEITGKGRGEVGNSTGDLPGTWKLLLEEKDKRIRTLEEEVAFLRARIERLEPLALPAPRRRWWPWWRKATLGA